MREKTMNIEIGDVYQLLISELRYAYRRNNHLMPACAYDRVKDYIPRMYSVDKECALHTLKQLCEECITEELCERFYDGYDDEFGNRMETIDFINWCMEWIHSHGDAEYLPYCWQGFKNNLAKDDEPRYNVYEIIDGTKKVLIATDVSLNKYPEYIFTKENLDFKNSATYRRIVERGEFGTPNYLPYKKAPIRYEFTSPTHKIYIVEHI